MAGFLGRWLERITPREGVDPSIRTAFDQALEIEGRITLLQPDADTGEPVTYRAMLERLDEDSFVVLAPDDLPARIGEVFEMAVLSRSGRQCGMVELTGHERAEGHERRGASERNAVGGQISWGGHMRPKRCLTM